MHYAAYRLCTIIKKSKKVQKQVKRRRRNTHRSREEGIGRARTTQVVVSSWKSQVHKQQQQQQQQQQQCWQQYDCQHRGSNTRPVHFYGDRKLAWDPWSSSRIIISGILWKWKVKAGSTFLHIVLFCFFVCIVELDQKVTNKLTGSGTETVDR